MDFNYPGDYLNRGILGWFALVLPLLGILSPILISFIFKHEDRKNLPEVNQ